jgi:putative endonuclease
MFTVYILKSLKTGSFYKGHTEDLHARLIQHNSGKTKSNKHGIPWIVVYTEIFPSRPEARKQEKYFKSAAGRRYLKDKINFTEDSVGRAGSIPVEATTKAENPISTLGILI